MDMKGKCEDNKESETRREWMGVEMEILRTKKMKPRFKLLHQKLTSLQAWVN